MTSLVGRNGSVGIAMRYGLDGVEVEFRWLQCFPHPSIPDLVPTQPSTQWVPGLIPDGKAAGAWRQPPTHITYGGERKSRLIPLLARLGINGLF